NPERVLRVLTVSCVPSRLHSFDLLSVSRPDRRAGMDGDEADNCSEHSKRRGVTAPLPSAAAWRTRPDPGEHAAVAGFPIRFIAFIRLRGLREMGVAEVPAAGAPHTDHPA